jgi:hypothetical protein
MDLHSRVGPPAGGVSWLQTRSDTADAQPPSRAAARLRSHLDIAWDFDGTLLDHPASPLMHRFIRENRHIRHVIVTFRSHGTEDLVWSELGRHRSAPDRACFDGVLNVPDEMWETVRDRRKRLGFARHLMPHSSAEQRYREWKGWACWQHGLTALVDDMPAMVAAGCLRYGVALFHPKDFLPN